MKSECFSASLMKNEKWLKDVIGQRWGKACTDSSLCLFIFGDKDAPFFGYREGIPHIGVLWPASGDGQKVLPAHTISQIPSAWNTQYAKMPSLGGVCPEPHRLPSSYFWIKNETKQHK